MVLPNPAGAITNTRGPTIRARKEAIKAWRGKEVSNVKGGVSLPTQHQLDEAGEDLFFKTAVSYTMNA
ncbi:hypothetical protein PFUM301598_12600 [Pseudomonas fluorescens]